LRRFNLLLVSMLLSLCVPVSAEVLKTYVSKQHSYSVSYPSTWRFAGDESIFEIYNFPQSRAVRGIVLPEGGEGLSILTPSDITKDSDSAPAPLAGWIDKMTALQRVTGRRTLEVQNGNSPLRVFEVVTECCSESSSQLETLEWFFDIKGRMFCVSGGHRKGDHNTDDLRRNLEGLVGSIRVLR
jgi:hypothetical protein